jgi:hypothetical protein
MRRQQRIAIQALVALAIGAASFAAAAQGPASAPRAASAPGAGPGPMGMMQGGGMRGWQANRSNTPGWAMMSGAERAEHHRKMQSMTSADECQAYMDKHRAEMAERAKQRGRTAPAAVAPRYDPCARLK